MKNRENVLRLKRLLLVEKIQHQGYLLLRHQRKYELQIVCHFLSEPYPPWRGIEVIVPFRNLLRGTLLCRYK